MYSNAKTGHPAPKTSHHRTDIKKPRRRRIGVIKRVSSGIQKYLHKARSRRGTLCPKFVSKPSWIYAAPSCRYFDSIPGIG